MKEKIEMAIDSCFLVVFMVTWAILLVAIIVAWIGG